MQRRSPSPQSHGVGPLIQCPRSAEDYFVNRLFVRAVSACPSHRDGVRGLSQPGEKCPHGACLNGAHEAGAGGRRTMPSEAVVGIIGWFFLKSAHFGPFNASGGTLYSGIPSDSVREPNVGILKVAWMPLGRHFRLGAHPRGGRAVSSLPAGWQRPRRRNSEAGSGTCGGAARRDNSQPATSLSFAVGVSVSVRGAQGR